MKTYKIVRFYKDHASQIIKEGLTEEEAIAHCSDPETSSRTCTLALPKQHTILHGQWFDGYEKE